MRSEQRQIVSWLETNFLKLDLSFLTSKTITDGNKEEQGHPLVSAGECHREDKGRKPLSLCCNYDIFRSHLKLSLSGPDTITPSLCLGGFKLGTMNAVF